MSEHFENFYARLTDDPLDSSVARISAMQVQKRIVATDGSGLVGARVEAVDYAGLCVLMHDDDLAALKVAIEAEIAARLP